MQYSCKAVRKPPIIPELIFGFYVSGGLVIAADVCVCVCGSQITAIVRGTKQDHLDLAIDTQTISNTSDLHASIREVLK